MSYHERPGAPPATTSRQARLSARYPLPADADHPDWDQIMRRAQDVRLPAGSRLLTQGMPCESFVLLLEGSVRVYQLAEDGREVTLYRINPGDICVMSLASLMQNRPFKAFAQADSDIEALVLGITDFKRALAVSDAFREWVLRSTTESFCDMLDTFHGAVFDRLEMRLACLLGRLFERAEQDTLQITHQQLAQELGTTREVISRGLKRFERQGCIELSRGQIRIAPGQRLPLDID